MATPLSLKSTIQDIERRFDNDVERFSDLAKGQVATIDAPLAMDLITEAAIAANGVQSRPDKLTGTAAQNKKVFDALVTAVVKERFNALLDELTGTTAAAQLGITTIPGFSAGNVQTALEQIVQAMQDVTQGSVTDGSITLAKLAAEVTAVALGGAAASHTHGAGDINSGVLDAARLPVLDGTKLGAGSVGTEQLGAAVVTSDKLAALSVLATHIAQGAVTAQKIAPGAVTAEKIAAGAIITALLAPNAVTAEKLANDIPYTKFGLAADQVRHVYAGTTEPGAELGSDGDIYLMYSE